MTDQSQLTTADVRRLFNDRKYQEIEDARVAGRLDDMLAGKTEEDE